MLKGLPLGRNLQDVIMPTSAASLHNVVAQEWGCKSDSGTVKGAMAERNGTNITETEANQSFVVKYASSHYRVRKDLSHSCIRLLMPEGQATSSHKQNQCLYSHHTTHTSL